MCRMRRGQWVITLSHKSASHSFDSVDYVSKTLRQRGCANVVDVTCNVSFCAGCTVCKSLSGALKVDRERAAIVHNSQLGNVHCQ